MLKSPESRILVTGGAGFIGSALVWELNRRGYENIIVSDRLCTDEKWKNLVPLRFHDYIDGLDLEQRVRTQPESLGKFDVILHKWMREPSGRRCWNSVLEEPRRLTASTMRWGVIRSPKQAAKSAQGKP